MPSLPALRAELSPRAIALGVTQRYDDARALYQLNTNMVADYEAFCSLIGEYYNYLFVRCISNGARLPTPEARSRAQEILARGRRGEGRADVQAFYDVHNGLAGGLRGVLDQISEGLKAEAVDRYVRAVLDRHVRPYSMEDKISITSQILAEVDPLAALTPATSGSRSDPLDYATAYERIVRAVLRSAQQVDSAVRGI